MPYVFRHEYHRITSGGFPHSEISGSKVGQHLTRAYRSRPRPSSALGAKAFTVCPYSLDQEELASYCYGVFKVRTDRSADRATSTWPVSQNSTAFVEVDVILGELGNRTAETIELAERLPGRVPRYP
jgi:hypothetical protein